MSQSTCFKQTELGEIPEEWEVKKIKDICKTASGGTPSRKESKFFGGGIPWVKSSELRDNLICKTEETLSYEGLKHSSAKIFPKGTVLVAMYGATVGRTGMLGIDAATNQAVCAFIPNNAFLDNYFLWYWLQYIRPVLVHESIGAAQPNISQELLRQIPIPLPPLEEQKRIAGVLRLVDEIIERTRQIVSLYEKAKKYALSHLLTKGIGHTRFKQTELGEIPEEWEVKRLGDVGIIRQGRTLRRKDYKDSGRFKILKVRDISETGEINWNINEKGFTDEDLGNEFLLQFNDILVLSASHSEELVGQKIGFIHTLPNNFEKVFFVAELLRVRIFPEKAVPYFIYIVLIANKSRIKPLVKGGHLYPQSLAQLQIPLPPLEEQKQIAEILSTIDKAIDNERRYLEALGKLKKWLLNNLLTGKVRLPEWVGDILKQVFPEG